MNRLVTWRYEFAIIAAWFVGSDCGLTTSLTIYGFGLRGNSANESIRKHRFRTKKHQKVNKSSQKTMAYLFGNWRPRVRVPPLRPSLQYEKAVTRKSPWLSRTFCVLCDDFSTRIHLLKKSLFLKFTGLELGTFWCIWFFPFYQTSTAIRTFAFLPIIDYNI